MSAVHWPSLFPDPVRRRLGELVAFDPAVIVERLDDPRLEDRLADAEILITGWATAWGTTGERSG
jgi:hypothetical protein